MQPLNDCKTAAWLRFLIATAFALLPEGAQALCGLPDHLYLPYPPYSATRLESVYNCVSAAYKPGETDQIFSETVLPMQYAGIETLRSGDGGIPAPLRVRMLNDYGFWLYKGISASSIPQSEMDGSMDDAVFFLAQATKLAPDRAVAWLNLGDAYAAEAGPPKTDADTSTLINLARRAYERYAALSPKPNADVVAFLALNPAPTDVEGITKFVIQHADAGDLDSLLIRDGTPVNLLGDGQLYYVYNVFQGTAEESSIYAWTSPQQNPDEYGAEQKAADIDFSPLDSDSQFAAGYGDGLNLIAFKGRYYVLDLNVSDANNAANAYETGDNQNTPYKPLIAHITIIQPNHGIIAKIDARLIPRLSIGMGRPLCDDLLLGVKFDEPDGPDVEGDPYTSLADGRGGDYNLANTASADIEQNGHLRDIAYFSFDSGAGSGCGQKGILLYDPTTNKAPDTPLNQELEDLPPSCDGGQDELISWQGKTYIKADNGSTLPGELVGTGIYTIRDEKIVPVCLIRNRATYSAE